MKTIVFDFGNVIGFFDNTKTLRRLEPHTDLSSEEMLAVFRDSPLEDDYEHGRISSDEFIERAQAALKLRCSKEEIAKAWSDIFHPNEEMCKLVPRLRGRFRLLLGSNTNELHATHFRKQFAETLAHFDSLVLSHEVGARKPNIEFFHHCHRLAHGELSECVFIDDLPENVDGAVAAGLRGIVFKDVNDLIEQFKAIGISIDGQ